MNLAAFSQASAVIQAHTIAALVALAVGAGVLLARKGTMPHVWFGRIWVALMLVVALSSFWIQSLWPGRFSLIHILSILTLASLPYAIWMRRRGNIAGHKRAMIGTFLGLLIAGGFTFLPGRLMHEIFSAPPTQQPLR